MDAAADDATATLQALLRQLDDVLNVTVQHASGEASVESLTTACASLAQAFLRARATLQASRDRLPAPLLQRMQAKLQTLHELHARLNAQTRAALAALWPQDALDAYAQLGRQAGPRTRW
ncbi:hypothetical protein Talka_00442 [Tepidimonas alkaliphilus]|uniref:FlgN protein n=1 Tax=Tepidimonas alkaliphilus TaxID=2588942 RepID=A0A554WB29_9BURK|nr:hypothetical protein [Tepidimonas alkaliphilus]TSE20779.1 hypothetical protein Talka_00442 [Tepidimonas alkaliphilus]